MSETTISPLPRTARTPTTERSRRTQFKAGNTAGTTHGGKSPRIRMANRLALHQELRELVLVSYPHLEAHPILLDLFTDALADVRQLRDFINKQGGPINHKGQIYAAMELLRYRERDAMAVADRLAITPRDAERLAGSGGRGSPRVAKIAAGQAELQRLYGAPE
jgi:hypothetical protein